MKWSDEYWPLIIQLYKKKPEGVKPLFSKGIINISLLLHIPPRELHRKMQELRHIDTPYLQHIWDEIADSPRKLNKAVHTIRQKQGLGNPEEFFEGVEMHETFERDFRPLENDERLRPIDLIMILNLYFQLTPTTMSIETDEVRDLARLLKQPARLIVEVMEVFQFCDPYLSRYDLMINSLLFDCRDIWKRFGNSDTYRLAALAAQLQEYYK